MKLMKCKEQENGGHFVIALLNYAKIETVTSAELLLCGGGSMCERTEYVCCSEDGVISDLRCQFFP